MIEELHTLQDASNLELANLRGDISSMRIEMIALRCLDSARVGYRFERDALHGAMMNATACIAELFGGVADLSIGTLIPSIDIYVDQLRERD